jgi:hypothetical protein
LPEFNEYRIFLTDFRKIVKFHENRKKLSNFMKICPVGAELFCAESRTEEHEVNSRFSQFCERAYDGFIR